MKWFRSNIKQGSRLALFALAVQFALSFGHFHAIAAPAIQSGAAQSSISYAGLLAVPDAVSKSTRQAPSDHDSDQQNDFCAICAVVAMANTALFATPPMLLLPQAVEFQYLATGAGFVRPNSARVAFQARAPPAS